MIQVAYSGHLPKSWHGPWTESIQCLRSEKSELRHSAELLDHVATDAVSHQS